MPCASGSTQAKLAARGLTPLDVTSALQDQNVEVPAGQLGVPPCRPQSQSIPDGRAR
jgi:multidrug efflux pump subunit AcrB